ncbi:MAG: substrate-binding domain-containing protein [Rhabdaerophilum sp.]
MDRRVFLAGAAFAGASALAQAQGDNTITLVTTTSTQDSGLLRDILARFQSDTGIMTKVVSLGTGQALDAGRRGDADIVLVHARAEEEAFVAAGFGLERRPVMYNDFIIVGPSNDPAGIRGNGDVAQALRIIRDKGQIFISRGDRSGTHIAELALWRAAGLDAASLAWANYRAIGQGMGAALAVAGELNAYLFTDRGTWISFRNKRELVLVVEGDPRLRNQYGVIVVNPARHPHVKLKAAQALSDWMVGPVGQTAIAAFRIEGQQLFFPNASEAGA